ncbi:MAG: NAD(+)/NADH kinase [Deltaproteobacteria bacterium]|nr:NAD(+)/NADH kinase [Deltaproteobacteria bacterium]MBW2012412.1 NAD(+)/NADH kinase [Deltaproteobacteria bacterium]MBW2088604.1 NAD(+)/NADH kinase [Deltaproteobacteria bacterium]MBW2319510.1 NAD(+)/NADH kinase [Deltaproteobacteria bacterium]
MKKVGIVVKADAEATKKADELENWLRSKDISVIRKENLPPRRRIADRDKSCAPSDLLYIFVLGGDGTFLSAVRWIGDQNIPIIGVKFGEVGFLAETVEEELFSAAEAVLNNKFNTELRMRLLVKVIREGKELACENVLNDIVINKGALARLAHIETYINDHYLTTYSADGLIVATPTGSTAYSLAAGGPIIHPAVAGILMTPICPFTLTNRPLIVPDSANIKIKLGKKSSDIMLTFDGQAGIEINEEHTIIIRKGLYPVKMITLPGQHYFDVLKAKLRWSGGRV